MNTSVTENVVTEPLPSCDVGVTIAHERKLDFMSRALAENVCFDKEVCLPREVLVALDWTCKRTPQQVVDEREQLITQLEMRSQGLRSSGACEAWLDGATESVKAVSRGVNGPLLQELARITQAPDSEVIEFFREGAPLFGKLHCSGIGTPHNYPEHDSMSDLVNSCGLRNKELLASLREDKYSTQLKELTVRDASLGRMSYPVSVSVSWT